MEESGKLKKKKRLEEMTPWQLGDEADRILKKAHRKKRGVKRYAKESNVTRKT